MTNDRSTWLPLLMPELLPALWDWQHAEQRLREDGLDPSLLTRSTSEQPALRERVRSRLTEFTPPANGAACTVDGPALAQDDFFEVRRVPGDEPTVFLLGFLGAHLDVRDVAESFGSGVAPENWTALLRGVDLVFTGKQDQRPAVPALPKPRVRNAEQALTLWRVGHRLFFVVTQGIIAALVGLARAVGNDDQAGALAALNAAATLSASAAAALRVTADFSVRAYLDVVRPSMAPPHVPPPPFSGGHARDHQVLVSLYRDLRPLWRALDPEVYPVAAFRDATALMFNAHLAICSRFGGKHRPSLLMEGRGASTARATAVQVLNGIVRNRRLLLGDGR